MTILYVATDQQVPGRVGGSVHVTAVARGLAALGHDVHVVVSRGDGPFPDDGATWIDLRPPFGARRLRWTLASRVRALAERIRPDVVIERYFNFGGEGVRAAQAVGALTLLEVNAPVIDHPGSTKRRIDRVLLVEPMRRWRDWQCRHADLFVTPQVDILPAWVPPERVVRLEWGADTARFTPDATGAVPFDRPASRTLVVFAGAFRAWHGAQLLVDAMRRLREHGRDDIDAVLIGDGPELPAVRRAAERIDGVTCVGPVAHEAMPACLAAADVGVAPFDVGRHAPSVARLLLVAAEAVRVHGVGAAGGGAGHRSDYPTCGGRGGGPAVRCERSRRAGRRDRAALRSGVAAAAWDGGACPGGARLRLGPTLRTARRGDRGRS